MIPERETIFMLLTFCDMDSMTFNVVKVSNETQESITKRTIALQQKGRRVRFFTSLSNTDFASVPSVESRIDAGLEGYTYDPKLRW